MSATFAKSDLKMATRTAVWSDRWRSHFDKKLKQRKIKVERTEETKGKTIAIRLRSIQPKTLESLKKFFTPTLAGLDIAHDDGWTLWKPVIFNFCYFLICTFFSEILSNMTWIRSFLLTCLDWVLFQNKPRTLIFNKIVKSRKIVWPNVFTGATR